MKIIFSINYQYTAKFIKKKYPMYTLPKTNCGGGLSNEGRYIIELWEVEEDPSCSCNTLCSHSEVDNYLYNDSFEKKYGVKGVYDFPELAIKDAKKLSKKGKYQIQVEDIDENITNWDNFRDSEKTKIIEKETEQERLHNFLKDDLKKLENHTNEIIGNIYARGQKDNFKEDIEVIENFFSYWRQHINKLK